MYIDNAALQKPKKEIVDLVNGVLTSFWANPNSLYQSGIESKKIIEQAREIIAGEINCKPDELIFCSCGSECNSLATCGYIRANNLDYFVTSTIEHSSIAENPYGKKLITVDQYGFMNIEDVKKIHDSLVSIQMANSEIGTIQKDFKEIVKILHENNCVVHTDVVAIFGKEKIDVRELGVDMLTATSQKIGGILGGAFLYKKDGIKLEPLIWGHNTLRGGTPNVASIAAMGLATEMIDYDSACYDRDYVWDYIEKNIPDSFVVGASKEHRLPGNLFCCFKNVEGESLQLMLNAKDICVSTGSACSSGSLEPSATLTAIGMDEMDAHSCIRLTFGHERLSKEELDYVCGSIRDSVEILRSLNKGSEGK